MALTPPLLSRTLPRHVLGPQRSIFRTFTTSRPSMSDLNNYLIPPSTLADALSSKSSSSSTQRIVPLCAAWFLPNSPHSGLSVFQQCRIPSAIFFDLDTVKDPHSPYPHMLPSTEDFALAMRALRIRRGDRVVVYDSKELGLFSAPRVGWMFKVMGHERVNVLDNFKTWVAEGYPVEEGPVKQQELENEEEEYPVPDLNRQKAASFEDVKRTAYRNQSGDLDPITTPQILDARPYGRFTGIDPEPRPGLSSGHIPGSISVPFSSLLDPTSGTLLPAQELRSVFTGKGVDFNRPVISSCGTGVTAAVLDAALEVAGYSERDTGKRKRVYDGSWTEWAQRVQEEEGMIVKGGGK